MSFSFHEADENRRLLLLSSRKDLGTFVGKLCGFSGDIYVFERPHKSSPCVCAKVPKVSQNVDAKEAALRFLREMKIQRGLFYHQFVHWPFDFDFLINTPVAWFRFWHGDLSTLIEDDSFSTMGRLAILSYIAAGMIHCHSKGLTAHQDFKPENIFVRDFREDVAGAPMLDVLRIPKIADFGSANLASEKGIFRGTRPYMAPEQWDKKSLGSHTTVWSIGVLTYELLSRGRHPIGEKSRPWRARDELVYNRWQNDRMWKEWRKMGMSRRYPLPDCDMDEFIVDCLTPEPEHRPTLEFALARLLNRLDLESPEACDQAKLLIANAEQEAEGDHDWRYLDERYKSLSERVFEHFGMK